MIIIADSGSTKADWRIIKNKEIVSTIKTIGFNPFFHSEEFIINELRKNFNNQIQTEEVEKIFFYGAGCSSIERNQIILNALSAFFTNSTNKVYHDILASARATCGNKPGIACILGTGSNSCEYDGLNIIDNLPSLGFMLGDEGSGSNFGKILIKKLFYRELSEDLENKFNLKYGYTKEDILNSLYNKPHVNIFLSKLSEFYSENQENLIIKSMVKSSFTDFFSSHILKYKNHKQYPIHFVGSIGFVFKDILEEVANDFGLKLGLIIKNPVELLVKFHIESYSENLI